MNRRLRRNPPKHTLALRSGRSFLPIALPTELNTMTPSLPVPPPQPHQRLPFESQGVGDVLGMYVDLARAQAFQDMIAESFAKKHHRDALNHIMWQGFYHVGNRQVPYFDQSGIQQFPPAESTVPCYDCGVLCRKRNIHIDHQRPKVGNDLEPVCKVFRAMGLTVNGPRLSLPNTKGQTWSPTWAAVGGLASQNVGGPGRDPNYTLNDMGKIYYTLAEWKKLEQAVIDACLNHIINLRPLCSHCNKNIRNQCYY
jgi:hypothetical protein